MNLFTTPPKRMSWTLRVLAHLLRYPDDELRAHLGELHATLCGERALGMGRLAELQLLIDRLRRQAPLRVEAEYVELFDRGRRTALHLFEHVHGDSRDRGPAMVDLTRTYEQGGLYLAPGELPDHLPVVLEFASTLPASQARAFLGEFAHLLRQIFSALQQRGSPYAAALAALLDLAGEKAEPVKLAEEEALDESWAEPAAFGGCSSAGQARPGQAQPIHFVKPHQAQSLGARP